MKTLFTRTALTLLLIFAGCNVNSGKANNSAEVQKAMQAYKKVLLNETTFYSVNDKKNFKLNELQEEGDDEYLRAESFSIVDLDGDGMPEVVIDFGRNWYGVVVLHYEEGKVYGFNRLYMVNLSQNGIYSGNYMYSAMFDIYYKVTSITKDRYEEVILARRDTYSEDYVEFYEIGEKEVTEDEYYAYLEKIEQQREDEAVWHDFTNENIHSMFK